MTTPVWCELVCRTCAATGKGHFTDDGRTHVQELKRDNPRWLFEDDEAFCSQNCLDAYHRSIDL